MEQLIPIASKLQDVLGALGQATSLDLPQIVVVGGQSSGKSSVLESLVGRSFLPRGTGIVTRRPLILTLHNTLNENPHMAQDLDEVDESTIDNHHSNNNNNNSADFEIDQDDPSASASSSQHHRRRHSRQPHRHVVEATSIDPHSGAAGGMDKEWGEFVHKPGNKYYDFGAIRREIVAETDRLTGKNKGVDHEPIHLKIYSPRVLALTLIDLPGIAKVPVGDQPANIEVQIRDMCLQYISNPNAIILAVTSANTDLANSDAIQMAQSVDPAGTRTVGVLTKLDLMDPGTDCADILMNQVIPLQRGYIAVVNRGQKDVNADLSIRDGLKKEEHFFRKHPVYSRDRALLSKCGTQRLSKALNSMLMHHIRDCLPDLKTRIGHMMNDVQKELDALGSPTHNANRSTRGAALLSLLSKFVNNFGMILDGRGEKDLDGYRNKVNVPGGNGMGSIRSPRANGRRGINELNGGARISYIFTEIFASSLMSVGAFDGLTDDDIRTTICNANGTRPALFVPEISFDILVRRQIARLEQPGIQCVDLAYEELQRIASQAEPSELTRFPILRDRMVEVVSSLLRRCVGPTQMMVANLVKIELAYVNTSHPEFIGGSRAVACLMEKIGKERASASASQSVTQVDDNVNDENKSNAPGLQPRNLDIDELNNLDGYDKNSSGIMSFIFRGATKPTPQRPHHPMANIRREDGVDGPPSVVHLPQVPDTMRQSDVPPTDRERVEMEIIKSLVESYFMIVRKNFIDLVPKTIMFFLVNHVRDSLQNELVSELYRDAEMGQLMQEAEDIASRRQTCVEMKDLLGKALEIVNEVRDFNTFK